MSSGVDILLYTTGEDFEFRGVTLILYTTGEDFGPGGVDLHHGREFCVRWCRLRPRERILIFVVYTT